MGWCISLCADPNSNPDANPHLAGEQQSVATPPGREKMGSPTLQTHQYPILLLPWLWFEVADQTLSLATTPLPLTRLSDNLSRRSTVPSQRPRARTTRLASTPHSFAFGLLISAERCELGAVAHSYHLECTTPQMLATL